MLYIKELLLAMLRRPDGMPGMESGLSAYKASALRRVT